MNTHEKENQEISRASGVMAGGTLISRVLGLIRNQILSHYFGAGIAADAFIAAFTIPNALRRLLGEGALTPAFVSLFTRELNKNDPAAARSFVSLSFWWLSLISGFFCLLGILLSPWLVKLYVPHFQSIPGKYELTVQLTQFLFPFLLLISWAALFMGVLNSLGRFAIPALGPALLNLTVISLVPLAFWTVFSDTDLGIFVFAGAILIGVTLQTLIFVPSLIKLGLVPQWRFFRPDPRILSLGLLLVPSVFSMGIYQLNIIVNRIFASDIPGAVAHLFYADLLIELPVSLVATSMAVAAIPSLSRLYAAGDRHALAQTFSYASSFNLMLAVPAMLGLMILGRPLISSLFFTGEFSAFDLDLTTRCLFYYSLGLPFFCYLRSLLPLFFAMKDTKTPALVGLVALIVNALAAWQLSQTMGAPGIALATSLSSATNCLILLIIVIFRFPEFVWSSIGRNLVTAIVFAGLMGLALIGLQELFSTNTLFGRSGIRFDKLLGVFALASFGAGLYFLLCLVGPQNPLKSLLRQRLLKKWF